MNAYELALKELGTVEWANGSNPKVVAYYKDSGHPGVVDDATAWCAAFVGAMLSRSGVKPSGSLLARSYLNWGVPVSANNVIPGGVYVGVIPRGADWQGHTFFIEKIVNGKVYALGGNMKDSVSRDIYKVSELLGIRRPETNTVSTTKEPANKGFLSWLKSLFTKG